jgi:lipid-binding SYLF domain-containing protein
LQIGIEGVDLVLIIQNERRMQQLLSNKFEIGGDASAAAGPVGHHASANTDWKLNTEILIYSRARGAFAGLTMADDFIRCDNDSTRAMYGSNVTSKSILHGRVAVPASAQSFLNAVRDAKGRAVASK